MLSMLALAIGLLALAGCGSSSSSTSSSASPRPRPRRKPRRLRAPRPPRLRRRPAAARAAGQLEPHANPEGELKYNNTSLTAKAGEGLDRLHEHVLAGHNVTVESSSGTQVGATPTFQGGSKTLSLNLKPGTYKFFCSVPGHRMAGMEGTLTVQ